MKRLTGRLKVIVGKVLTDESLIQLLSRLDAEGSVDLITLRREGMRKPDTSMLEVLELITVEDIEGSIVFKPTEKLKAVLNCWYQFLTDMAALL
jgi:hypothetical protein